MHLASDPGFTGPDLILVLTGPHGAGKTYHTRTLASTLREQGLVVHEHHPAPPPAWCRNAWDRAVHYAYERIKALGAAPGGVMVAARWDESTTLAAEHAPEPMADHMRDLASYEWTHREPPVLRITLDADPATLDARLTSRHGRPQTAAEKAEAAKIRELSWPSPTFDTSKPREEVATEVAREALRLIGKYAPHLIQVSSAGT